MFAGGGLASLLVVHEVSGARSEMREEKSSELVGTFKGRGPVDSLCADRLSGWSPGEGSVCGAMGRWGLVSG